ncbi:unnamed protein product [Ceratitis capitata]|uniref:(Mediterranean fruit fly) hypothetical protein n=1 Tax=Ceratitis capitata TaxID=7213 RepID=A0A811U7U7_CERCA|nr:unnamed protein product [Ceratitis capitata]
MLTTPSQNQRDQQQHTATPTMTKTTTEATTRLNMSRNTSTATTKAEKISPTGSNATLTTTTTAITLSSAITTRKPITDSILLPASAKYLQMKGAPASSSSHLAPPTVSAQYVATTKSINVEETTIFGPGSHEPPLKDQQLHENKINETKIPKVFDEITTTTPKNMQQLSTTAIIAKNSPPQPKVDINIKQNNNNTDGHEEKASKQHKPATTKEHDAKGAAETKAAAAESLEQVATRPKAVTHFWQQHNFKRANPSPSDNFGRRQEPGYELETRGGQTKQTMEDVRITEHTLCSDTTTAESEHIPATTPSSTPTPHKHEPLQLHIRDRHLIGTPLLMHRGDNMLVEAADALRQVTVTAKTTTTIAIAKPTTKTTKSLAEKQTTKSGHRTDGAREDEAQSHTFVNQIQAVEAINRNVKLNDEEQGKLSANMKTAAVESSTETTTDVANKAQLKPTTCVGLRSSENLLTPKGVIRKHDDIAGGGNSGRRKPTLIMKKMTIQTKHTQQTQMPHHHTLNTPRENEVMQGAQNEARNNDARDALTSKLLKAGSEWHNNGEEAAALLQPQHKHSTVNTPIIRDRNNHAHLLATLSQANADTEHAPDAPKAQHSISNQHSADYSPLQLQEHAALHTTQTQKWLGTRHVDASSAHPGLVILLSFSLLALLLVGLMHVYRCDVLPWRRHLLSHQQRPHLQRQFNSAAGNDDVHSFLQYHNNGAGQQQQQQQQQSVPPRWHHGTRSRADYSSPLHNLHVRELQKTSAVEAEAAARITRSYYDVQPYAKSARRNGSTASSASGGSSDISRHSSSSLSSTHSSCSAAAAAGMMDADDTFYVEMAAECAQLSASDAIHCDMLPMELLTAASAYQHEVERETDTTVHETESLTLGGGKQAAQNARTAIHGAKACGNQSATTTTAATKLQQWRSSNSTLFNNKNGRSKRGAKAVGVSSSSSSATSRKFDLW